MDSMLRIATSASAPVSGGQLSGGLARGDGLAQDLGAEYLVVELAREEELVVGANGGDTTAVEYQDEVGVAHGRDPLSNDEHGAVALAHQPVEGLLDRRLGLRVHRRGAVVEDEEPRVYEERPRYGYALALAAREPDPPLADEGIVASGERADKLVCLRCQGRGLDLLLCRVRLAVGDVVAHRAREEQRGLHDDPDLASQARERHVAHVVAVEPEASPRHVVEARDQVDERGLARAGGAEDRHRLSRLRAEVCAPQDLALVAGAAEANPVELDSAADGGEGDGVGRLLDLERRVEDLEY